VDARSSSVSHCSTSARPRAPGRSLATRKVLARGDGSTRMAWCSPPFTTQGLVETISACNKGMDARGACDERENEEGQRRTGKNHASKPVLAVCVYVNEWHTQQLSRAQLTHLSGAVGVLVHVVLEAARVHHEVAGLPSHQDVLLLQQRPALKRT